MDATDFVGKFLLTYSQGEDVRHPTAMTVEGVEMISGRLFVVGREPKTLMGSENWHSQSEIYLAWDKVSRFYVYENEDAFSQSLSENHKGGFLDFLKNR